MDKNTLPVASRPLAPQSQDALEKVLAMLEAGESPRYQTCLALLETIPEAERGPDWARAIILLHGAARRRANLTFNWLNLLCTQYRAAGAPHKAAELTQTLDRLMGPYTIGAHGFAMGFGGLDGAAIARETLPLIDAIAQLGHQVFINSGTLLGAVRGGELIAHDDDIDLAILVDGDDLHSVAASWQNLKNRLRDQGLLDLNFEKKTKLPIAKIHHPSGITVDIFPAWISDGKVYVWPHTFGELSADEVFPLGSVLLHGHSVPAPKTPERMLALNYGEGWKTPDSAFKFPWPQARKRFRPFIDAAQSAKQEVAI